MDLVKNNINKIIIIMMGGIGNMILLTPALKVLKKNLPNAKLFFLVGSYNAEKVLEGSDLLDGKIIVDSAEYRGVLGKIKLIKKIKDGKFDLSITSTGTNPIKSGLLMYLAGIKERLGEDINGKSFFYNSKVSFSDQAHEVEQNIKLIEKLGINVTDKSLFIHIDQKDRELANNFFIENSLEEKRVIGIHPGSGIHQAYFKRWSKEKFAQLGDMLVQKFNCGVLILGGPDEQDLANEIAELMKNEVIIAAGKTTLKQTAVLIQKCQLFISNDSGLAHIAAAVNIPEVVIWGPTDYNKIRPYSDLLHVVKKDLKCMPCYNQGKVKCQHLDCLKLITVDEVFRVVEAVFVENSKR